MRSETHDDIRKLLKQFGLTADETLSAYIIENKPTQPLRVRIVLEEVAPGDVASPLRVEVEGEVKP
jgi:hypothetical protein